MLLILTQNAVVLLLLLAYTGVYVLGAMLPYDNSTQKETDTTVLPYNIRINETVDVCTSMGPKIVGGSDAKQGDFPYQVSIRHSGWDMSHFCGGSVIDEQHVLTAAHCVYSEGPGDIKVVVGDVMLDRSSCTSVRHHVSDIFVHENYNVTTLENDIALIRVSKPFPTDSSYIMKIQLMDTTVHEGAPCNVSGWGVTKWDSGVLPKNLQFVEVPIISTENCSNAYSNMLHPGMICAGCQQGGKDSCQGDSGGPLQCDSYLVGIVSWGAGCAEPNNPGVYTEVAYHLQWIEATKLRESSASIFQGHSFYTTFLLSLMITTVSKY